MGRRQGGAARKCNGAQHSGAAHWTNQPRLAVCTPFAASRSGTRPTSFRSRATATFKRPVGGSAPGFRSQFLRAVDSIGDNIAEGAGQRSQRQFAHYLEIAIASAHEADNQLERARALGIFDPQEARKLQEKLWEVKRMLTAFHRAVKRRADEEDHRDAED